MEMSLERKVLLPPQATWKRTFDPSLWQTIIMELLSLQQGWQTHIYGKIIKLFTILSDPKGKKRRRNSCTMFHRIKK